MALAQHIPDRSRPSGPLRPRHLGVARVHRSRTTYDHAQRFSEAAIQPAMPAIRTGLPTNPVNSESANSSCRFNKASIRQKCSSDPCVARTNAANVNPAISHDGEKPPILGQRRIEWRFRAGAVAALEIPAARSQQCFED